MPQRLIVPLVRQPVVEPPKEGPPEAKNRDSGEEGNEKSGGDLLGQDEPHEGPEEEFNRPVKLEKLMHDETKEENDRRTRSGARSTRESYNRDCGQLKAALQGDSGANRISTSVSSPLRRKRNSVNKSEILVHSAKDKTEFFNSLVHVSLACFHYNRANFR